VESLEHDVDMGAMALGAFARDQLVGIGVVVPHLQPNIAQLAPPRHAPFRATGFGSRLTEQLEPIARAMGDPRSSSPQRRRRTPSASTSDTASS
jgi:hypothetical protein